MDRTGHQTHQILVLGYEQPMRSGRVIFPVPSAACPSPQILHTHVNCSHPGILLKSGVCGPSATSMIRRFGRRTVHCPLASQRPVTSPLTGITNPKGVRIEKSRTLFPARVALTIDSVKQTTFCESRCKGCHVGKGTSVPRATSRLQLPAFKRLELSFAVVQPHVGLKAPFSAAACVRGKGQELSASRSRSHGLHTCTTLRQTPVHNRASMVWELPTRLTAENPGLRALFCVI
jgi:hypothetical protein